MSGEPSVVAVALVIAGVVNIFHALSQGIVMKITDVHLYYNTIFLNSTDIYVCKSTQLRFL